MVGFIEHDIDPLVPMDNIGSCFVPVGNPDANFVFTDDAFGMKIAANESFYVFNPVRWDFDIYTYTGEGKGWFAMYADGTTDTIESVNVAPNASMFYMGAAPTFKMAGQVRASGDQSITFTPNPAKEEYMFPIANPFPVATTFADLETFCAANDSIYVFNPGRWDFDIYTYTGKGNGWFAMYADGTTDTLKDSTAVIFAPGQGGIIMPGAQCTWTKTLNY